MRYATTTRDRDLGRRSGVARAGTFAVALALVGLAGACTFTGPNEFNSPYNVGQHFRIHGLYGISETDASGPMMQEQPAVSAIPE